MTARRGSAGTVFAIRQRNPAGESFEVRRGKVGIHAVLVVGYHFGPTRSSSFPSLRFVCLAKTSLSGMDWYCDDGLWLRL